MYDGTSLGGIDSLAPRSDTKALGGTLYQDRWYEFLIESSEEERRILNFGISSAITSFLSQSRAVYLYGLGVIFPKEIKRIRSELSEREYQLIEETVRVIDFEKCSDLVAYQRERFANLVECKELLEAVKEKISFFVKWKDKKTEKYIKGLIYLLRHEVVGYGYSERLSQLGTFYALHNRQGSTEKDWLSGADIFIRSEIETVLQAVSRGKFVRPVLRSACEPLDACFGKQVCFLNIDVAQELLDLGLDIAEFRESLRDGDGKIHVSVYCNQEDPAAPELIFCSEGLRRFGNNARKAGTELVLRFKPNRVAELTDQDYKDICQRPFVLAWMLLAGSPERSLAPGEGLSVDQSLLKNSTNSNFSSILLTNFSLMSTEQLTNEGKFNFINIVLLFSDEAAKVAEFGSTKILTLMERRALINVVKESRTGMFGKSGVLTLNPFYRPTVE